VLKFWGVQKALCVIAIWLGTCILKKDSMGKGIKEKNVQYFIILVNKKHVNMRMFYAMLLRILKIQYFSWKWSELVNNRFFLSLKLISTKCSMSYAYLSHIFLPEIRTEQSFIAS